MAEVFFRVEVYEQGEIDLVSRSKLVETTRRLKTNPEAGKPLRRGLLGLRSIRIGGAENRLVYQYLPDADRVEIIAIGRRRDDDVYEVAAGRIA